ncbi:MAG: HTH domain-containing protein [Verrucomicrobiales bacterium]|nr:HTH domain-containing protein [Verrucomicrobiales bacterium]
MAHIFKSFRDLSRPQWFAILELVKQSTGVSVPELAEDLGMSYMGVKKHCVALEKLGYLDTWRRPKQVGRPEKLYRLTSKADVFFPGIGDDMVVSLLEAARQIDPNAAEKLLFSYFQNLHESYRAKVKGNSVLDRATSLAKYRESLGYFSHCEYDPDEGLRILEYHNPLQALFDHFPTVERMELQIFERILSSPVERTVETASGLRRYRFDIATL